LDAKLMAAHLRALEEYNAGTPVLFTLEDIGEMNHLSYSTVRKVLVDAGVVKPRQGRKCLVHRDDMHKVNEALRLFTKEVS